MNKTHTDGGIRPTPQQELLLRAALLQGRDAVDAWNDWKSSVDINQLDQGSYRLLPLLYRNLLRHQVNDPLVEKLKGVYRLTWSKNQLLFHKMGGILGSFHDSGIKTLVLKGAALVALHYRDMGRSPMSDFDVLVHTEDASAAINRLTHFGWKPTPPSKSPKAFTEGYISVTKGFGFNVVGGQEIDLHWHMLTESCHPDEDDDFWDGAVPTEIGGVSTYTLNTADHLLHVCVHGASWNYVAPFRWVADAMMILDTSQSDIDWNRLVRLAHKHRVTLPLKDTLCYLRDFFSAPVPLAALQHISGLPVPRIERIEYQARTRPAKLLGPLSEGWLYYLRYWRLAGDAGLLEKLFGFPRYFQRYWVLDHLWQVPICAIGKVKRRVFEMIALYRRRFAV